MNTEPDSPPAEKQPNAVADILKRAGTVAILPMVMAAVALLSAGRLDWTWPWVYVLINLANVLVVGRIAVRRTPESDAERGELETIETSNDAGSIVYILAMYIVLPLVAGLGVRFGWAPELSMAWHAAGAALLALGLGLTAWATMANPYMMSEATIQRGQTVCSSGPYRLVRHPGYAGLMLQGFGVPILLGSLWALIPGIAVAVCMIMATSSEDGMLQAGLPGYRHYARQVRFRLVPGIW